MTKAEHNLRRRLAYHLRKAMLACKGRPMGFDGCVVFQANVHRDAAGIDPIARWRGRYTTRRGMVRVMGHGGVPGCMRKVARAFGWKRIAAVKARIGDVGIVRSETGPAVVRKLHRDQWIGRNATAWSVVPDEAVTMAWNICGAR